MTETDLDLQIENLRRRCDLALQKRLNDPSCLSPAALIKILSPVIEKYLSAGLVLEEIAKALQEEGFSVTKGHLVRHLGIVRAESGLPPLKRGKRGQRGIESSPTARGDGGREDQQALPAPRHESARSAGMGGNPPERDAIKDVFPQEAPVKDENRPKIPEKTGDSELKMGETRPFGAENMSIARENKATNETKAQGEAQPKKYVADLLREHDEYWAPVKERLDFVRENYPTLDREFTPDLAQKRIWRDSKGRDIDILRRPPDLEEADSMKFTLAARHYHVSRVEYLIEIGMGIQKPEIGEMMPIYLLADHLLPISRDEALRRLNDLLRNHYPPEVAQRFGIE